jgi:uncharacterized protein (TIGR00369 family)
MAQEITEHQNAEMRKAVPQITVETPFIKTLGLRLEKYDPDEVTVRLPFRTDLTNDGTHYHGGVIASVIDTSGAMAAFSNHDFNKGANASTISMTINYVGVAKKSDLICEATTKKRGKELIFTEITAYDSEARIVAHAIQTYRIA